MDDKTIINDELSMVNEKENSQFTTHNSSLKEGDALSFPKGYKLTEVGVIPEDWEVRPLEKYVKITSGESPSKFNFVSEGKPYFKVEQLNNSSKYSSKSIYCVNTDKNVIAGSIIFPKRGASIFLNKIRILKQDSFMDTNLMTLIISDELNNEYIYYQISYIGLWKIADTTSVPQINNKHINPFKIPLPPSRTEQTAIATALSDMDALIEGLEKLLVKKRNIKQGAMQELLKPKDDWVEKELGKVATLKARIGWQGLTTAEYKATGDYFLITGTEFKNGFINWDKCNYVEYERYKQDKNIQVKEYDVLVTKDGTIGKIALIKVVPKPATLNSGVFVIRPINKSFDSEFFYYLLMSEVFLNFLSDLSAGSTINHLYQKDFVHFKFKIPKTIKVQEHIAQILSDMDTEITQLETQLSKYKMLKTGMMQELLTGKKRLV